MRIKNRSLPQSPHRSCSAPRQLCFPENQRGEC